MLSKVQNVFNTKWPVKHGGTTLNYGSFLMPGVTAETNLGLLIVGSGAAADMVGRLKKQFLSTETDSLADGTVWNLKDVEPCVPYHVDTMEYDTADTMAVASTSTTTVTITSLEDNIDTSWLYGVSGTGIGLLTFIQTSAAGSCVTKTATGWDATTTVLKILRNFHQIAKLNTAADKIGTDAAAGSWTILALNNKMRTNGSWYYLDPTKNDGQTGLNLAFTKFYAEVGIRNAVVTTID